MQLDDRSRCCDPAFDEPEEEQADARPKHRPSRERLPTRKPENVAGSKMQERRHMAMTV